MRRPNFDVKRRPVQNVRSVPKRENLANKVESFSIEKLKKFPDDIVELFKLIQAVRYDKVCLQEKYNECRLKLNNDRMKLESELIKIKKDYNVKISALQEEYNSVKSNTIIELAKLREG